MMITENQPTDPEDDPQPETDPDAKPETKSEDEDTGPDGSVRHFHPAKPGKPDKT